MLRPALIAVALLSAAAPAAAQTSSGLWNYHYHNGIGQYLTGQWDASTGGALNISCLAGGRVAILAQIKGQAPPPNSVLHLAASSRAATLDSRFPTDAKGRAEVAVSSPAFRQLWASLRAGDTVVLRYADGRTSVQSLAGAAKLLPAKPCG